MFRVLPLLLMALALLVFASAPALADDKGNKDDDKAAKGDTHEGFVVNMEGRKLTMKTGTGADTKEHRHDLKADTKVWVDGKEGKFIDLRPGMRIRVHTKKGDKDTVLKIEALNKEKDFPKIRENDPK